MTRIYWDTMLFIYWLEGSAPASRRVETIHRAMQRRGDQLLTSVFTLGELLVKPYQRQAWAAASRIREALRPPQVELLPMTEATAERYAQIRAQHRVSPADALHLACAACANTGLFLTNDHSLARLAIPGIAFIATLDTDLF